LNTAIFTKILSLGLLYPPSSPIWVKLLGMQVRAHGGFFRAKCHRNQHILLYITTHNNANITDLGNFGCSCIEFPTPIRAKRRHTRVDSCSTRTRQISSDCVNSIAPEKRKKTKFYRFFNFVILRWLCPALCRKD